MSIFCRSPNFLEQTPPLPNKDSRTKPHGNFAGANPSPVPHLKINIKIKLETALTQSNHRLHRPFSPLKESHESPSIPSPHPMASCRPALFFAPLLRYSPVQLTRPPDHSQPLDYPTTLPQPTQDPVFLVYRQPRPGCIHPFVHWLGHLPQLAGKSKKS